MKDTSRPHPNPSSRPAPYRKRKASGPASPTRSTRRVPDASQSQGQMISPRAPEQAHSSRRHEDHSRAISSADGSLSKNSKKGGNNNDPHARKLSTTDGPGRERLSHAGALSRHGDVPSLSLRLPLASALPTTSVFTGQSKAESPPPGSVTAFLRSIELPDKPSSAPPLQTSLSLTPPSLRQPPLSTDSANKLEAECTNENDHQVSLVYKGYPFSYDLSALPDDPKGTIALLTITKSDPGAYLLVGAHYRRTGRSRAACAVIRSLLDNLNYSPSDVEKGQGDAATTTADTSTVTLPSSGSCPKPIDRTMSAFKGAAIRPALLLLAACELDISREHPDDPESNDHASTAHELFRAVYGSVNDGIIAGAIRPKPKNALGLEFPSYRNCPSVSSSEAVPLVRVKELEKELNAARVAQKTLHEKLIVSNDRLTYAEDKVRTLESRSREMLVQLNVSRDENWELRQRLAESERRASESAQCVSGAENRVWGRLKDLFDNLGGGVRGE